MSPVRFIGAAVFLVVVGCGGVTTKNGNDSGTETPKCKLTFADGMTAFVTCEVIFDNVGGTVGIGIGPLGTPPQVATTIKLTGATLVTGTWTPDNSDGALVLVANAPGEVWCAARNNSRWPDQGTFTLTITASGDPDPITGGTEWLHTHGSLNATLQPQTGASGEVILAVTF